MKASGCWVEHKTLDFLYLTRTPNEKFRPSNADRLWEKSFKHTRTHAHTKHNSSCHLHTFWWENDIGACQCECLCVCVRVCVCMRHTLEHAGYNTYTSCKRIKHQKNPKDFHQSKWERMSEIFSKDEREGYSLISAHLSLSLPLSLSKSLKYHPCFYDEERARKREKGG